MPSPKTRIQEPRLAYLPDVTLGTRFGVDSRRRKPGRDSPQGAHDMPYVITEPCIGVKDKSCVTVCPVDCIYEADDMLYINPDECIDCGLCEPECPVTAIFVDTDVPPQWKEYIEKNAIEGRRLAEEKKSG